MRKVKDGTGDFSDGVGILANETSQRNFTDFGQLGLGEAAGLVAVLVPESVATSAK